MGPGDSMSVFSAGMGGRVAGNEAGEVARRPL